MDQRETRPLPLPGRAPEVSVGHVSGRRALVPRGLLGRAGGFPGGFPVPESGDLQIWF